MKRIALVILVPILMSACECGGGGGLPDAGGGSSDLTWYRDVLPIAQKNCQGCHAVHGHAPFSLMEYQDAFIRHGQIADAVATRRMPLWLPDDSCVALKNPRRLSAADIDIVTQWSAAGAPAGNPADAPLPPAPQGLAWVSATLDPGVDYVPVGTDSDPDDYRCLILPPAFDTATDLIGYELLPGTEHQVHHAILFAVDATAAQNQDDGQSGPGWTCYGGPGTGGYPKMLGGWVPGTAATRYPDTTGIRIDPGEVIVMQVHYNLSHGAPVADRTRVNLQFAPQPVQRPANIYPMFDNTISIPPNTSGWSDSNEITLPPFLFTSATLWGVTPHMHELGRRIRVERIRTTQNVTTRQCLIDIPNWDFNWQQPYEYATPLTIQAGDTLRIECTWDNPTSATVNYGEGTADEMCMAFFYSTVP
jgi:hypothetical protein